MNELDRLVNQLLEEANAGDLSISGGRSQRERLDRARRLALDRAVVLFNRLGSAGEARQADAIERIEHEAGLHIDASFRFIDLMGDQDDQIAGS